MAEFRTKKQIDADKLDLECFNLCLKLERFAHDHKDDRISGMASSLGAMRHRIRLHMHKNDVEKTNG